MCDCNKPVDIVITTLNNITTLELILNIIIFGIISSFTHCIGMCGAIAIGQASIRLINDLKKASLYRKIIACIAWEYYIGKAITYSLLTFIVMRIGQSLKHNTTFNIVQYCLLLLLILYFIYTCIQIICGYFYKQKFVNMLSKFNKTLFNTHTSTSKLFLGMALGLIPCGIVYSAIGMIVSSTNNTMIAMFAAFIFGLMTLPGLFILSFSGNIFFLRYKNLLNAIYFISIIYNIKILCKALIS